MIVHRKWATVGSMESPDLYVRKVALNRARSDLRRHQRELSAWLRSFRLDWVNTLQCPLGGVTRPTDPPCPDDVWSVGYDESFDRFLSLAQERRSAPPSNEETSPVRIRSVVGARAQLNEQLVRIHWTEGGATYVVNAVGFSDETLVSFIDGLRHVDISEMDTTPRRQHPRGGHGVPTKIIASLGASDGRVFTVHEAANRSFCIGLQDHSMGCSGNAVGFERRTDPPRVALSSGTSDFHAIAYTIPVDFPRVGFSVRRKSGRLLLSANVDGRCLVVIDPEPSDRSPLEAVLPNGDVIPLVY